MLPTMFTENPMSSIIAGLFFTGAFAAFGFMLQKRSLYVLSGLAFAVMIGLVYLERSIVTDNEQLRSNLYRLADMVSKNDLAGAKRYFSAKMTATVNRMETEMPEYKFRACRITGIRPFVFDSETQPTKATVDFTVFVNVDASIRFSYDGPAQRGVVLKFEKEADGQWRIVDYNHYDPRQQGL